MTNWRLVILLAILCPIWIPAALFTAVWWALWSILSWLRLPTLVNGPLVILMLVLMIPFYPIVAMAQSVIGQLFCERISVGDFGLDIIGRKTTKRFTWQEIAAIVEVFSPPINHFKIVLRNGEEFVLSQFADIGQACQAAPNHDVLVQLMPNPAFKLDTPRSGRAP
jgi:hypothetical protein